METGQVVHMLSGAAYDRYVGRFMPRYSLQESLWADYGPKFVLKGLNP